jgi:hypothetical protein
MSSSSTPRHVCWISVAVPALFFGFVRDIAQMSGVGVLFVLVLVLGDAIVNVNPVMDELAKVCNGFSTSSAVRGGSLATNNNVSIVLDRSIRSIPWSTSPSRQFTLHTSLGPLHSHSHSGI